MMRDDMPTLQKCQPIYLLSSGLYRRSRNFNGSTAKSGSQTLTAGQESHPALKMDILYHSAVRLSIGGRNDLCKYFYIFQKQISILVRNALHKLTAHSYNFNFMSITHKYICIIISREVNEILICIEKGIFLWTLINLYLF